MSRPDKTVMMKNESSVTLEMENPMTNPDRDEARFCKVVLFGDKDERELRALLRAYIEEVRRLRKEFLELFYENNDQKTELGTLKYWQKRAVKKLQRVLDDTHPRQSTDMEILQLIEEAK